MMNTQDIGEILKKEFEDDAGNKNYHGIKYTIIKCYDPRERKHYFIYRTEPDNQSDKAHKEIWMEGN